MEPYVYDQLKCPDPAVDSQKAVVWHANDMYAQILIVSNIAKDQMVHVAWLNTAHEIWTSLRAIHKTKDYSSAIALQCGLFEQHCQEGGDVVAHLTKIKQQWERVNVIDNPKLHIGDLQFKMMITTSLPASWDAFTKPYMGGHIDAVETDPKKLMSSQVWGIWIQMWRRTGSSVTTVAYRLRWDSDVIDNTIGCASSWLCFGNFDMRHGNGRSTNAIWSRML